MQPRESRSFINRCRINCRLHHTWQIAAHGILRVTAFVVTGRTTVLSLHPGCSQRRNAHPFTTCSDVLRSLFIPNRTIRIQRRTAEAAEAALRPVTETELDTRRSYPHLSLHQVHDVIKDNNRNRESHRHHRQEWEFPASNYSTYIFDVFALVKSDTTPQGN